MAATATATANDRRIGGAPSQAPPARTDDSPPRVLPVWALKMKWDYEAEVARLQRRLAEMEEAVLNTKREQRALTTVDRRVSLYGTEQVLREMTMQVALCPKFKDLEPQEHRYVAMVGLVTGLTPEFYLHAWKNKKRVKDKKTGKYDYQDVLTVLPDYKALIVRSRPLMEKERRLTPDEMRERGIPDQDIEEGSIAYVLEGYEVDVAIKCRQAGIDYEPKRGYGWWQAKKDEEVWDKAQSKYVSTGKRIANDVANGRDGAWMAKKRAIRDLYNQFADLTISLPGITGAQVEAGGEYVFTGGDVVIDGTYTETPPADWLTPAAIEKAEAYRAEQGVSDEAINTWLKVDDWRTSPVTADEFKVVVDQLAMQADMEPVRASATDVTNADPEPPEADHPPVGSEPKKCKNCGIEAAVETPLGDDYCETCAKHLANKEAAKK